MWQLLTLNAIMVVWYGFEALTYYASNRLVSDFVTGWVVQDGGVVSLLLIANSIFIFRMIFTVKYRKVEEE